MDFGLAVGQNCRIRARITSLEKSSSEPDLSGCVFSEHFTPRFPDNIKKLLHEYVSVDDLKCYRKKKPTGFDDEVQSKSNFSLYDKESSIIPFSALKTEYDKEFGKTYPLRSRSVPKKICNLNETTRELIEALRDDDTDVITVREKRQSYKGRSQTAKISGGVDIKADELLISSIMKPYGQVKESENKSQSNEMQPKPLQTCTLKLEGELTYSPEYRTEYHSHPTIERSQSIPQMAHIKFQGNFQSIPEYKESYQRYVSMPRNESLKRNDNLKLNSQINAAIISPFRTSLTSEYTDRFNEKNIRHSAKTKSIKQFDNFTIKNDLIVGHQQTMPLYRDSFKTPPNHQIPAKAKGRSSTLALDGNMEYSPEYRSSFVDFPRNRPTTKKPDMNINLFDVPPSSASTGSPAPMKAPILKNKYTGRVAVVEPSKNVHHPTGLNVEPTYLCQPEVRKARREILLRERPPSPHKTIAAAIRSAGPIPQVDEDEENRIFQEKSRMITSAKPKIMHVTVENVDEPNKKPETILSIKNSPKFGRRAKPPAKNVKGNVQKMRNQTKIIEGNRNYINLKLPKKNSLTSTTTDDENKSNDETVPSFVVLKDPCNSNKWMKSSWYN